MADPAPPPSRRILPRLIQRLESSFQGESGAASSGAGDPGWTRHTKAELLALQEIHEAVGSSLDAARILGVVVKRVAELLGAARCSILLAARESAEASVVASHEDGPAPTSLDLGKYPEIRKALAEGKPVVVEDLHHDPLLAGVRAHLKALPGASIVVLPVRADDLVIGALFVRTREAGRGFADREIRLLEAVSALAGQALERSIRHEAVSDHARRAALEREVVLARYELLQDYTELLEHTSDAIFGVDGTGIITGANRRATALTGYVHAELIGMPVARIVPPGEIRRILALRGQKEARDREQYHLPIENAEGRRLGVRLTVERQAGGGEIVTLRDNSVEKRHEERLAAVNARLVELNGIKNAFMARGTHELKTPLTVVNGYLRLLEGNSLGPLNDDQREVLAEARAALVGLQRIVADMLDLTKLEAREMSIEAEEGDLGEAVRAAVARFGPLARESGVSLTAEAPAGVLAPFDGRRLDQVLTNLLSNALKFTPRGGRIIARARLEGRVARIDVEDSGPGIAPEHRERVFEEFAQVSDGHLRAEGTGLGLAIARRIVEAHGGAITVDDSPGGGALFTVRLPSTAAARAA